MSIQKTIKIALKDNVLKAIFIKFKSYFIFNISLSASFTFFTEVLTISAISSYSCCSRLFFNNIAFSGSECLNKFTGGEGIPVIVDTVCIPSSFEQCVQLACPAGRIVVIGLKNQPSAITMADITKKN